MGRNHGKDHGLAPQDGGITPETVLRFLERVLASQTFQGSQTLSRFLRYIVEQTLEGRSDRLKEYTLGIDVLGRPESFEPRTDAAVRIQASRLRARLAAYYRSEGASDPIRIELARGGYVPTFHPTPQESRLRNSQWHWRIAVLAAAAVVLILAFAWRARTTPPTLGHAASREPPPTHIAVLPFVNLDPGTHGDHSSEEITIEVMNTLASVQGLRLVGRSSAFQIGDRDMDTRQIGRQLNVVAVVEGTVRTSAGGRRVTARLVDTRDSIQLWSETFDRTAQDGFAIHEEIGRGIARTLNLPPPGDPASWNRRSTDPEAYRLVLQARYLMPTTVDTAESRIGYYRAAIDRDLGYSAPWIGMADTWCRLASASTQPPREVMEKARGAVKKALELDDTNPEAHFLAASISWSYDWNWAIADREFRQAIQLDPSSAVTRNFYAKFLSNMGRFDEAFSQLELVRRLDPITSASKGVEASVIYLNRQYSRTIQFCESGLSANPSAWPLYYWLGRAYGSTAMIEKSLATLQKLHPSGEVGGRGFGMLGATYARAGSRADALKLLAQVRERAKHAYVSPVSVAQVYIGLGDHDRAFEWLDKGYQDRDETMVALKVEPAYDPIRGDSRFHSLLQRLNLE